MKMLLGSVIIRLILEAFIEKKNMQLDLSLFQEIKVCIIYDKRKFGHEQNIFLVLNFIFKYRKLFRTN